MNEIQLKDQLLKQLIEFTTVDSEFLSQLFCNDELQIQTVVLEFEKRQLAKTTRVSLSKITNLSRLDYAFIFYKNGGFAKEIEGREKIENEENKFKALQMKNIELQNENLEYSQTIRDQIDRIRSLEEKNKFFELLKHYWWVITLNFGLGVLFARILW